MCARRAEDPSKRSGGLRIDQGSPTPVPSHARTHGTATRAHPPR